jgi:hypothetical protein
MRIKDINIKQKIRQALDGINKASHLIDTGRNVATAIGVKTNDKVFDTKNQYVEQINKIGNVLQKI